jgi:dihydroorotase
VAGVPDLIVRGGRAVLPGGAEPADVWIEDGRIAALAPPGTGEAPEVLDATGCLVLPGAIDAHVHFRAPGLTHKEDWPSASLAAVAGGVTTVVDMPNTVPPTVDAGALRAKAALAAGRSWCHFAFHGGLARGQLASLPGLAQEGALGFKVFLGETTASLPPPEGAELLEAFRLIRALGRRLAVHAEDGALLRAAAAAGPGPHGRARPPEAEVRAVEEVCALALQTGAPVMVVHLSTAGGAAAVRAARARGADVQAEATPHHLLLSAEEAAALGPLGKVNPPLRAAADVEALWVAVGDGTVTQLGSDHAPHTAAERAGPDPPSGFAGVQNTLPYLLGEPRLPLAQFVRLAAEGPARHWGLWPRKGRLAPGADADLAIVRLRAAPGPPARQWSRNPDGPLLRLRGARADVVATLVDGRVAFRDGAPVGEPRGRWLRP